MPPAPTGSVPAAETVYAPSESVLGPKVQSPLVATVELPWATIAPLSPVMATCTVVLGSGGAGDRCLRAGKGPAGYQALFGELATLEQQRRSLRERLIG